MRTVTFSDDQVQRVLNNEFVCCYTDTTGDPTAGASFSHAPGEQPGPCGKGAGRQNVQVIFMTPASEIFHVATGFLEPDDLLTETTYARELFADLQRNRSQRKQTVVASHESHLRNLGFKPNEIAAADNQLSDMFLGGPNPQDFGINMPKMKDFGVNVPGAGANMFQDIARQRLLKDHKFVMRNPLMTRKTFEESPQSLVGHHKSFFGSNAAMNGVGDMMNKQINRRAGRFK
jgi:hypothetical protein